MAGANDPPAAAAAKAAKPPPPKPIYMIRKCQAKAAAKAR
jgi:hypothetical protein